MDKKAERAKTLRREADRILGRPKPKRFIKRKGLAGMKIRANRVIPRPTPKPMAITPPELQPGVRYEADDTWSVVQGPILVKAGFPSMASAWAWIDRDETHSLQHTNAGATRSGAYTVTRSHETR